MPLEEPEVDDEVEARYHYPLIANRQRERRGPPVRQAALQPEGEPGEACRPDDRLGQEELRRVDPLDGPCQIDGPLAEEDGADGDDDVAEERSPAATELAGEQDHDADVRDHGAAQLPGGEAIAGNLEVGQHHRVDGIGVEEYGGVARRGEISAEVHEADLDGEEDAQDTQRAPLVRLDPESLEGPRPPSPREDREPAEDEAHPAQGEGPRVVEPDLDRHRVAPPEGREEQGEGGPPELEGAVGARHRAQIQTAIAIDGITPCQPFPRHDPFWQRPGRGRG